MLFLTRKRIYIILSCLVLSTIIFQVSSNKTVEVQETVALPVNNKVIVLDAGHGRRGSEAQ